MPSSKSLLAAMAMRDVVSRSKAATELKPVPDSEKAEVLECYGKQDIYDWMLLRRRTPTH